MPDDIESLVAQGDPEALAARLPGDGWEIWGAVTRAAAAATSHAEIERLVALAAAVKERAEPAWLGPQLREEWNDVPPDRPASSWTNLNTFAALLTPDVHDATLLGLWSIGLALEGFDDTPALLPAAVAWFEFRGDTLLAATLHNRTYAVGRPGFLARHEGLTEPGFSVPRWTFWRSRLGALSDTGMPIARKGFRLISSYDARIARGLP